MRDMSQGQNRNIFEENAELEDPKEASSKETPFWYYDQKEGILHMNGCEMGNEPIDLSGQLLEYKEIEDEEVGSFLQNLKQIIIEGYPFKRPNQNSLEHLNLSFDSCYGTTETISITSYGKITFENSWQPIQNLDLKFVTECKIIAYEIETLNITIIDYPKEIPLFKKLKIDVTYNFKPEQKWKIINNSYSKDYEIEIKAPIDEKLSIHFENIDFSKLTLSKLGYGSEITFFKCENFHQIQFGKEVELKTQRHLLQRIGQKLREDKYLPEAELVFDREMEVYTQLLEEKKFTQLGDYLILKFSKWFSNFGKSLWRPLVSVMIAAILGHSLKLWSSDDLIWGQLPTAKDVENILAFILDLNLIPLIQNTGFCGILIIALKSFIAYCIYNFLRATRRFNG